MIDLNHPTVKTQPSDHMKKKLARLMYLANVKRSEMERKGTA